MKTKLTFLREDFRVSLFPQLASDLERQILDTSGRKCLGQYGKYRPSGLSGKMFLESLLGTNSRFSSKSALIWKVRVMKSRRLIYQLARLERRTSAKEFGLLPTPTKQPENEKTAGFGTSLIQVSAGLIPIPQARDWKSGHNLGNGNLEKRAGKNANIMEFFQGQLLPTPTKDQTPNRSEGFSPSLETVLTGLLPTPQTQDGTKGHANQTQNGLCKTFQIGKGSRLSHHFVGQMMGFPTGWTDIPFGQKTENTGLPDTELRQK